MATTFPNSLGGHKSNTPSAGGYSADDGDFSARRHRFDIIEPATMSALPRQPLSSRAAYSSDALYRLSVEQYHQMIETGTLTADDPVELIDGMLVFKMPKNPLHMAVTGTLNDLLSALLPVGWHCRTEGPITLYDGEPEPDIVVARGNRKTYNRRHPAAIDIAFVCEISDSTLARDRGQKLRTYARNGIAEYWLVNLASRSIDVYRSPETTDAGSRYTESDNFPEGTTVSVQLDGRQVGLIAVAELLSD